MFHRCSLCYSFREGVQVYLAMTSGQEEDTIGAQAEVRREVTPKAVALPVAEDTCLGHSSASICAHFSIKILACVILL